MAPSYAGLKAKAALVAAAALALAVNAQDSPYIPNNGVSDSCAAFLARLDSHPELARCSSNLLAATSLFDPSTSSSSSSSNNNANAVDSTLARLCSPASQCSKSTVTQALTWFSGNCTAELAANQPLVRSNYDVLYVLYPFTRAACTKDPKSSEYCATRVTDEDAAKAAPSASSNSSAFANAPSNSTTSSSSGLFVQAPSIALGNLYVHIADAARGAVSRLRRRQATQSQGAAGSVPSTVANATSSSTSGSAVTAEDALLPNATTFRESGLPFLFLSGEMGQSQLCTECTKEILAAYVGFETDFPYGSGLSNSPILGAQASLWNDMGKVCGSGFLSAITSQSGSNSFSAAPKSYTAAGGVLAVAAAGLAGFVALL